MNDVVWWAVDNLKTEGQRDRKTERQRERQRERERENMHKIKVTEKVCNQNFYYGFKCYQDSDADALTAMLPLLVNFNLCCLFCSNSIFSLKCLFFKVPPADPLN